MFLLKNFSWLFPSCLLVICTLISSEIIEFNLVRTKSLFHKLMESGMHPKHIEKLLTNGKNTSEPLFRYQDNEFYGEVLIGHPGQKFNIIFDTAWANSWVPSITCVVGNLFCIKHNKYDSEHSSTYKEDGRLISIPYQNDSLEGFLSTDLVHIGQKNITSQTFAEMTYIPNSFLNISADGVFGLSFPSLSLLNVTPFLDNMVQQKTLDKKVFSFFFNRNKSSKKGGTLFLGGSQTRHYSRNFTYVNLIASDYWRFNISSIHLKGIIQDLCDDNCPAILDTSSSAICGPPSVIFKLNRKIQARLLISGKYEVNCETISKLPSLTFNIGGRNFVLKPRSYIQKVQSDKYGETCFSVFEPKDFPPPLQNYWTLGASFMSQFYVEFDADNKRLGFTDML